MKTFSIPILLFAVIVNVYLLSPVATPTDSAWTLALDENILNFHTTTLDNYTPFASNDYRVERIGIHFYSYFPIGTPILALPFVALTNQFLPLSPHIQAIHADLFNYDPLTVQTEKSIASLLTALAALCIYFLVLEMKPSQTIAVIASLVFAFATPAFSTASRALWGQTGSLFVLSAALLCLVRSRRDARYLFPAGALLAFSYVVRPTNAISLAVLSIYVLFTYRKWFIPYALAASTVLVPFLLYNQSIYHAWLAPYYQAARLTKLYNFDWALSADLFSPNRGIFVFSPFLLFIPLGIIYLIRRTPRDLFNYALLTVIGLHWLAVSAYWQWWGGTSFGPRLFTDIFPYLIYFLAAALQSLSALRLSARIPLTALLVISIVLSVFIHSQGAMNFETVRWNWTPVNVDADPEHTGDWSDLQFLRGFDMPVLTHKSAQLESPAH